MYPSLASQNKADVLRLIRTNNVGPITFFQLIMRYGNATEALAELPGLSIRGGRKHAVKPYSRTEAEQEIERTEKYGARLIMYGEAEYPQYLMHISDPPPVISVYGNTASYQNKSLLAVVGSRNASANGCQLAQKLSRDCGNAGLVVVSGLARGIDTYAHKGALATGTVAVVAGGIDHIYPPENTTLYHEIRENGAIISEQPFGQVPFAGAFPSRNRIIAGMSQATLVVEASPKSGSLITARLTLDYNRDVFAVPGSPLDPRAKGCNMLIKQGAIMAEDAQDIVSAIRKPAQFSETPIATYSATPANEQEVAQARAEILGKLGHSAIGVDELVEQCHLSPATVQAVLLELDLAGKLKRSMGNKVSLLYQDEQEVA